MEHFHLYTGNSLELLGDRMMEAVTGSPDGVFTPERFIVQSRGMELWLSQHIARRRGICANVSFDYPDMFLQSLYRSIPGLQAYNQEESGWKRETLAWIIMRVLPSLLDDTRFAVVRSYLQIEELGTLDEQKLFQLSVRIADMFDQYMIFRPDRVRKWEEGIPDDADEDAVWQAMLWHAVAEDPSGGRLHRARIQQELIRYLSSASEAPPSFPKRVTVFGISYLPQYYVEVLLALSRHVDVHYFTINPSAEYWSDVATPHQQRTLAAARQDVYVGNILLASLGIEGRDFYEMLLERNLDPAETGFAEPPRDTLLHCIQNDIFHYRDAQSDPEQSSGAHAEIGDDDRSIVVQNCHSRLREMEVLHDHLLSMFEADRSLEPNEVIVMAPGIEE
jgi:exodeoxyribonuclease V gamma subunit